MSFVSNVVLVATVAAVVAGCANHDGTEARAGTEGQATYELVDGTASESLAIHGPPGELIARFEETSNACTLVLDASEPRAGDHTSAAKRARVVLRLRLPATPALLAGTATSVDVVARSPLAGDAMVRAERGAPDGSVRSWYSVKGGRVQVDAFEPRVGSSIKVTLEDVALEGQGSESDRMLRGSAVAALAAPFVIARGGCPDNVPGR